MILHEHAPTAMMDAALPPPSSEITQAHWKEMVTALFQVYNLARSSDDRWLADVSGMLDMMPSVQEWRLAEEAHPETALKLRQINQKYFMHRRMYGYHYITTVKQVKRVLRQLRLILDWTKALPDPKVAAILAMDWRGGIGLNNDLPWKLPNDLKRFRELTMGNVVIMGYNTYMSLGKPLDGRRNIVITSKATKASDLGWPDEVHLVDSVLAAIELAKIYNTEWIYIIGGGKVYDAAFPYCSKIELTLVTEEVKCDTYVSMSDWGVKMQFELLEIVRKSDGEPSHAYYRLTR